MSSVEYLISLNSILFAWTVAIFLDGWATMIHYRARIKPYSRHLIWTLVGALSISQSWWALFWIREEIDDNFFNFFIYCLPGVVNIGVSMIIFPPKEAIQSGAITDYKRYVQKTYKWFYGSVISIHLTVIFFQWHFKALNMGDWLLVVKLGYIFFIAEGIRAKKKWWYYDLILIASIFFLFGAIIYRWHLPSEPIEEVCPWSKPCPIHPSHYPL